MLSLTAAAKLARVSKSTIGRAINRGQLSATRLPDGSYEIDPAELHRVYPVHVPSGPGPDRPSGPSSHPPQATPAEPAGPAAVAVAELAGARQLIAFLEAQVADLRQDRDGWRQQAERLALAAPVITPAPPPSEPAPAASAPPRAPWWRRLAG